LAPSLAEPDRTLITADFCNTICQKPTYFWAHVALHALWDKNGILI